MSSVIIVLVIGFIILIHEWGHFWVAKKVNIPIEDFSIGFGKSIWHKKIGETTYHIRLIPLGGFVLPKVETTEDFFAFKPMSRIWFSLGGPLANFILAFFLYLILHLFYSPFATVFSKAIENFFQVFINTWQIIPILFTEPHRLSGIIGIVAMGNKVSLLQPDILLSFIAGLSINLGILNLLPIPALDGGKVVLSLLEKIHPSLKKMHIPLSLAGWLVLVVLFVYITGLDIHKLIRS